MLHPCWCRAQRSHQHRSSSANAANGDTWKTWRQYFYVNWSKLVIRTGNLWGAHWVSLWMVMVLFVIMPLWDLSPLSKHTCVCFWALMPKWINMSATLEPKAVVVHWLALCCTPAKTAKLFPPVLLRPQLFPIYSYIFPQTKSSVKHSVFASLTLCCGYSSRVRGYWVWPGHSAVGLSLCLFRAPLCADTNVGKQTLRMLLRGRSQWVVGRGGGWWSVLSGPCEASKHQTEILNGQLGIKTCRWATDRSVITPKFTPTHKRNVCKDLRACFVWLNVCWEQRGCNHPSVCVYCTE